MTRSEFIRSIAAAMLGLLPLALTPAVRAQESPVSLMRLAYLEVAPGGDTPQRQEVEVQALSGATPSPLRGKPLPALAVLPGTTLKLAAPPFDVVVDLYHGTATIGGDLLCSIRVHYVAKVDGTYVPHYQIYKEPVVFRAPDGRWIPIEALCANAALLKFRAPAPANSEGFYATFEFGLTNRALEVDSWVVRQP